MVEIWDNHSKSLKNIFYNDFKGTEYLLAGVNLENEIDTCQTTVRGQEWFGHHMEHIYRAHKVVLVFYQHTLCWYNNYSRKSGYSGR